MQLIWLVNDAIVEAPFRVIAPVPVVKAPVPVFDMIKFLSAAIATSPFSVICPLDVVKLLAVPLWSAVNTTSPYTVSEVAAPFAVPPTFVTPSNCVSLPVPTVKDWLAATAVAPFKDTAPVPVENVFVPL